MGIFAEHPPTDYGIGRDPRQISSTIPVLVEVDFNYHSQRDIISPFYSIHNSQHLEGFEKALLL